MMDKQRGVRRRVARACARCRQLKVKCNGLFPCSRCIRRKVECRGDERPRDSSIGLQKSRKPGERAERRRRIRNQTVPLEPPSSRESPAPPLTNPLAIGSSDYSLDTHGRPIHLGTSSSWSFARRVLHMTYEATNHAPLPSENLLCDGTSYDLGWDEQEYISSQVDHESVALPSADHALYLINTVQFHCGQLFYLLDEYEFMQCFYFYHEDGSNRPGLWYIHYLLILAFGKAFVVQNSKGQRPPGADLFLLAMNLLPPAHFFVADAVRMVQVLCCAALYLQCIEFRGPAYRIIGQALRVALQEGLHTEMHAIDADETHARRCRRVWWTVYILDRQMSSLMGVSMAVSDNEITASLPSFPGETGKATALEIQVKLSRVLAQILGTVYGPEGRLDKKFLSTTKSALRSIADVADHLNESFSLPSNGAMQGVSRVSASLHIMQHQCIVLATRPLLYSFLESRIGRSDPGLIRAAQSGSVRNLLLICIDSAQQMLTILSNLQSHDILEGFLRLDLDATFTAHITMLMAPTVDPSLIKDQSTRLQRGYSILDDIISRGNKVAVQMKSELQQLQDILSHLPMNDDVNPRESVQQQPMAFPIDSQPLEGPLQMDGLWWQDGLTAEQLMNFAESIDIDSLEIL